MVLNAKKELEEFRKLRGQSTTPPKKEDKPVTRGRKQEQTPYDAFLRRYADLENSIDSMGNRDLVYYFREIAEENGYKYVISNIKKDMAIMKRLHENFSSREICTMIEFLYESEQDYLDKERLSINILGSQWINSIYPDMKLWVNDEYVPRGQKSRLNSKIAQKEWDKKKAGTSDDVNIGVKL